TSQVEDHAYWLLGILDVRVPQLYREGAQGFIWRQHGISYRLTAIVHEIS
ncbi:uncharacterized protein BCR38DRAFT_353009, partial [Pseudomassariella vexata]